MAPFAFLPFLLVKPLTHKSNLCLSAVRASLALSKNQVWSPTPEKKNTWNNEKNHVQFVDLNSSTSTKCATMV